MKVKHLHQLYALSLLLLLPLSVKAQQVSIDDALSKARTFLSTSSGPRRAQGTTALTLAYTAKMGSEVQFYVFNKGNGNGFIIIGGDERANEILGYSDNGTFDYNSVPANVKEFLLGYQYEIHNAISNNLQPATTAQARVRRAGAVVKKDIAELMKTKWNQTYPYNTEIPKTSNGDAMYTGCVITATSQIMKFWEYPTKGIGSKSFSMSPLGQNNQPISETMTFSADFGNTTYDWANMPDAVNATWNYEKQQYIYDTNEAQNKALGTLMYHVGVCGDVSYGTSGSSGSGADPVATAQGIIDYFGYPNTMSFLRRKYYTDDDWETRIYNELAEGRPILYSGDSETSGHAYVVHGYRASDNTFAINWGWGGSYDGYFPLTGTNALRPAGTGAGGAASGSSYNLNQSAVIGISAKAFTPEYVLRSRVYNSEKAPGYTVQKSGVEVSSVKSDERFGLENNQIAYESLGRTDLDLGLKCTNVETGVAYYLKDYGTALGWYGQQSGVYGTVPSSRVMPSGKYTISIAYKPEGTATWYEAVNRETDVCPTIDIVTLFPAFAKCNEYKFADTADSTITTSYDKTFKVTYGFTVTDDYKVNSNLEVCFKFVNGDDVYYSNISAGPFQLPGSGWGYGARTSNVDPSNVLKNGKYSLIPVCKDETTNDWIEMKLGKGVQPLIVNITGRSDTPTPDPDPEPEPDPVVEENIHVDASILSSAKQMSATYVSGKGSESAKEVPAMLFDGSTSTKWCRVIGSSWANPSVVVDMGQKINLYNYSLTEGEDTYKYRNRNWATWRIYGSNDKSTWTKITEEQDATTTRFRKSTDATQNQHTSVYSVANSTDAYQYYMVEVTSLVDKEGTSGYIMQMAEMAFYGKVYVEPIIENVHADAVIPSTSTKKSVASISGTNGAVVSQNAQSLVDGNVGSRWYVSTGYSWSEPYAIMDMGKKIYLTNYKLTEGDDSYVYPSRNWATWTIYGSNDQSSWTKVSQEADATTTLFRTSTDKKQTQYTSIYAVQNSSVAYRYYKVIVNSVVGTSDNQYAMQMAEMEMYGTEESEPEPEPDPETVHQNAEITSSQITLNYRLWAPSDYYDSADKETVTMLVDDNGKTTKWCKVLGKVWPTSNLPYFQLDMTKPIYLTHYSLTEGDDTYSYPTRNWATWEIYGSNDWEDEDSWVIVAKENDPKSTLFRLSTDKTKTQYTSNYAVADASKAYRYYMIKVCSLVGKQSDGNYVMQMSDMKFYGTETEDPDPDPQPTPSTEKVHENATITDSELTLSSYWDPNYDENDTEGAYYALDHDTSTKWCHNMGKTWDTTSMPYIQVDMGKGVYLTGYSLTEGADTYNYPSRNWATWEVYGSNDWNDDDSWVVISQESDASKNLFRLSTDKTKTQNTSTYAVQNTKTKYQYYMIVIGSLVGKQSDGDYIHQMAEIHFFGNDGTVAKKQGDVNGDDQVNISDVTSLVNIILGKASKSDGSDVNGDGQVNISDVTTLVNIILGKK